MTNPNEICQFISTVFQNTHKSTAVIGLSGGIDSAVSFALTVKALGPEHVHAYFLPSKTTPPQNLNDIQHLTSDLRLSTHHFHTIPIKGLIQKSWRTTKKNHESRFTNQEFVTASGDSAACRREDFLTQISEGTRVEKNTHVERNILRLANLAARIRMMILFDQAKKLDGLVIGTENRSETLLGYFTRFGDQASDLEPIAHLYKTQVIELAKELNIPQTIIDKPPSADLWSGQTDEKELGFSYQQADPILIQLDQGQTPTDDLAAQVVAKVNAANFKHQVPYTIPSLSPPKIGGE